MLVQSLVASAHHAWPPMVHVPALPERGSRARVPRLEGVRIDGHGHVLPDEAEHDLRLLGLGQVITSVGPDGRPVALARPGVPGTPAIAINGGTLTACLTPERLVGAFLSGRVGGEVALDPRSAWAFSLPWSEVEQLTQVQRAPSAGAAPILVGLAIAGPMARPGPGALVLEPGNWLSLPGREVAPVQDVRNVVDEVASLVAGARGLAAVPAWVPDETGLLTADFTAAA